MNAGAVGEADVDMWFWTLGAYEVVRTMSQAKKCFSESAMIRINETKKHFARARMPAAKMEPERKKRSSSLDAMLVWMGLPKSRSMDRRSP